MNKLQKAVRVVLYGALAALVLETAARVDDWLLFDAPLFKPYTINTLFRASPNGREGVPGAHFAKWHMNQLGFRGPEPVAGRTNILTFGASETFGLYESPEHEYPRVLESDLNAVTGGPKYNVLNAAMPGMRIGRVDYLAEVLDKSQAAYMVVYPSPANYIGTDTPYCKVKAEPSPPEKGLGDKLRIAGKFELFVKKVIPPWLMTRMREYAIWRATRHQQVESTVPDKTIEAMVGDLNCVIDVALSKRAQPILMTHATYFGHQLRPEDHALMLAWRRFYPDLSEQGFLDLEARANQAIRTLAQTRGVALVDLANVVPPGPAYFADFVHFTDKGSQLVAAELAAAVRALPPLDH